MSNSFTQNALGALLKTIQDGRGNNYMKSEEGKFTVDALGLREMNPQYLLKIKDRRNKKAQKESSSALNAYYALMPLAQENKEARSQLNIFADVMTNPFGQYLVNGQITTFKKITAKLSEVAKRSPIILLMKRIVQLNRAKAMVTSYIQKYKTLAKSEKKQNDPTYQAMRAFNQVKNQFKKMKNDASYAADPNYKLNEQFKRIQQKRNNLFNLDQKALQKGLLDGYQKQLIVQSFYKDLGVSRKKMFSSLQSFKDTKIEEEDSATQPVPPQNTVIPSALTMEQLRALTPEQLQQYNESIFQQRQN